MQYDISEGEKAICGGCKTPVYWVLDERHKRIPVLENGTPHDTWGCNRPVLPIYPNAEQEKNLKKH